MLILFFIFLIELSFLLFNDGGIFSLLGGIFRGLKFVLFFLEVSVVNLYLLLVLLVFVCFGYFWFEKFKCFEDWVFIFILRKI